MRYGSLKPEAYVPRACDALVADALNAFGAVEIAGTMWCGKTWTSLAFGESVTRLGNQNTRRSVEADPSVALLGASPHVIDEWQDVPMVWDSVRDAVDESGNVPGSYILTGSSSPSKGTVFHSGAGRIAKVRMRTMSLAETGESSRAVSLRGLFEGSFEPSLVQQSLAPLAQIICRGGWPAVRGVEPEKAARYIESYLDALFEVNMVKRGLDDRESRLVARSLARNMGSAVKLETIAADAFAAERSNGATARIASEYIRALEDLYVVEQVSGWDAPIKSKSRLRMKPKRYFADPSLAAQLLQVDPARLLEDGQLFGTLFESLCMHDLAVYASLLPHAPADPLHYYRDADGLEVDAIIELRDGRWAGIEIKLGDNKVDDACRALDRLRRKVALNPAARNPQPTFMAVLVGAGQFARYDKDRDVYVIPLTALAP